MYYPFLRARQFELIALRELALEGALEGVITPILEPIKDSMSAMNLALKVFRERSQQVYVVVNPVVGERIGNHEQFIEYLKSEDPRGTILLPAFHCNPQNLVYIEKSIEKFQLQSCMLICGNDLDGSLPKFKELVNSQGITAITLAEPEGNRSLTRFLQGSGKAIIRLDDKFEAMPRNVDYLELAEHRFSEEHAYYRDDKYTGFADYTTLSSGFIEGGGPPLAVAIHLTYLKDPKQIWIRHFTSETNDTTANVQGKFEEAARKAVKFCQSEGLNNSAIAELTEYVDEERYPGLGTVKKISIKNHLLVVGEYLRLHS